MRRRKFFLLKTAAFISKINNQISNNYKDYKELKTKQDCISFYQLTLKELKKDIRLYSLATLSDNILLANYIDWI